MQTTSTLDYAGLAREALDNGIGGFTVGLDGSRPLHGWAVSLPGHEVIIPAEHFSAADLDDYVNANIGALIEPGHYLGAWQYNGHVYLDVSRVFDVHSVAIIAAEEAGQRALYNLDTQTDEPLRSPAPFEAVGALVYDASTDRLVKA